MVQSRIYRGLLSYKGHKLDLSSVEGLGGFIGSLPQHLVVADLLNQVEDLGGQSLMIRC